LFAFDVRHAILVLLQRFGTTPILSDLVAGGKLKVVGAVYDIATGKVMPV